jgi:hypothetical protein
MGCKLQLTPNGQFYAVDQYSQTPESKSNIKGPSGAGKLDFGMP